MMDRKRIKALEEDLQCRIEDLKRRTEMWNKGMIFACLLLLLFCSGMSISIWTRLVDLNQGFENSKRSEEALIKEIRAKFELDAQEELNGNKNEIKR